MDDFNKKSDIYPNLYAILSNEQRFSLNKINEINFLTQIRDYRVVFLLHHSQVLLEHLQEQLEQVVVLHF